MSDLDYIDLIEAEMLFNFEDHRAHVDAALASLQDAHVIAYHWAYAG